MAVDQMLAQFYLRQESYSKALKMFFAILYVEGLKKSQLPLSWASLQGYKAQQKLQSYKKAGKYVKQVELLSPQQLNNTNGAEVHLDGAHASTRLRIFETFGPFFPFRWGPGCGIDG